MTGLVTENQSLRYVVAQLEKNDALTEAFKAFFSPYCTTSLVDWLKTRILGADAGVIAKVSTMIAATPVIALTVISNAIPAGTLVNTYCTSSDYFNEYADGSGGITAVLREVKNAGHPC